MNMLDLMNKMTQLSEAKEKTKTGLKHTAEPGGYGRKDDEDDEGHKVKAGAVKKGKGRPKKDADDSGETKKYDFSAFGVKSGKDVKLPKHDKKKTTVVKGKSQSHADNKKDDGTDPETKTKKKGLKEYFDSLDKALNENEISSNRIDKMNKSNQEFYGKNPHFGRGAEIKDVGKTVDSNGKPISALATNITPKFNKPGQVQRIARGSFNSPVKESDYTTAPMPGAVQVKDASGKVVATAKSPQAAEMFKKGDVTLGNPEEMHEEDIGKHNNATTGFDALVRKLTPKYGKEAATKIAGAQMKKIKEADQPPNDSLLSPMSEARAKADDKAEKAGKKVAKDLEYDMKHKGKDDAKAERAGKKVTKDIEYDEKKKTVKEAAKPDFPDIDNDGNKKETISKAAQDAKRDKKKVKEGMEHKLKAARHTGKAHALSKQGYNCGYDDMEESRHYHEGYKEGLDECYGQMPGYVGETNNEVADMASYGAHTPTMEDELDEVSRGEWIKQKAKSTPGPDVHVFGQTLHDKDVLENSPFAFEAWEKELNSILEGKDVTEGMTVSISKGQQGTPDSVSVSAQDAEADQLLSIIKQSGMGLFGGDDAGQSHASQPMTVDVDGGEGPQAEIEVVDDHDDMLSLIRKMTGQGPAQSSDDYEEEGGHEGHSHEEECDTCGESPCGCESEEVDEDENMAQREEQVAETEEPPVDNNVAQAGAQQSREDAALATAAGQSFANTDAPLEEDDDKDSGIVPALVGGALGYGIGSGALDGVGAAIGSMVGLEEEDEDLEESLANGNDDTFEADIDFMTNVITGGQSKKKINVAGNGQSTIPAVAIAQENRLGSPMRESTDLLTDWRKLSGIK